MRITNTRLAQFALAVATLLLPVASHTTPAVADDLGKLIAQGAKDPADAVKNLDVYDGLEVTLSASEPDIVSLTNLAVDHRGRVWVCEVVNYRHNRKKRPEGDRILILEDTTGDGVMDKQKVYYQGPDVNSAIGIGVFGNKTIVSCAPNVLVFTDTDGDDVPDKKEPIFTGIDGWQHDHSIHSFVFGPDGKFYFNMGNVGGQLKTPDGKIVVDKAGNEVRDIGKPYRQGMVFRCDEDGTNVETLAHNFRNNYEVAVDAFGTMWQSDNDDDGNRGVRINYVMEYGNYGYTDEISGEHWGARRINRHEDVRLRHWHQNDPGSIPNLLQTGAGSPTGMVIYEGDLLPEVFHGQMIHCDPGPSIVRAYPVKADGAGYKASVVNLLEGTRDQWFRPADVAVAPDGSLFVSDWYDPGVGGHRQDDTAHGRLFRVAPPGHKYQVKPVDYSDPDAAAEALVSPNEDTRYRAWHALREPPQPAPPEVKRGNQPESPRGIELPEFDFTSNESYRPKVIFEDTTRPSRHRVRAFWALAKDPLFEAKNDEHTKLAVVPFVMLVGRAATDKDPNIQIAAIRRLRQTSPSLGKHVKPIKLLGSLANDPSPLVRREVAIALREFSMKSPTEAAELWAKLALQYDGPISKNPAARWYMEALGIGAHNNWDACLDAWLELVGDEFNTPANQDIIWRSRAKKTPQLITHLVVNEQVPFDSWPRWIRALDFQATSNDKSIALHSIADYAIKKRQHADDEDLKHQLDHLVTEVARRISDLNLTENEEIQAAVIRRLGRNPRHPVTFDLIVHFRMTEQFEKLVELATSANDIGGAARPMATIVRLDLLPKLDKRLASLEPAMAARLVQAVGYLADQRGFDMLTTIAQDEDRDPAIRTAAAKGLGRQHKGQRLLLDMAAKSELPEQLKFTVANILLTSWDGRIRIEAAKHLSLPETKSAEPLPPLDQLVSRRGDAAAGRQIFLKQGTCVKCHKVAGEGTEVGPDLSEIGSKLSREAMYVSILDPSAGVSHNYETYAVILNSGLTATGILVSQGGDTVTLKNSEGVEQSYARSDIDELEKLPTSLMPADLQKQLTAQDLVNLVEYLTTLKKAE